MIISRKPWVYIFLTHPRVHLDQYDTSFALSNVFTGPDSFIEQDERAITVESLWGAFYSAGASETWGTWRKVGDLL